MARTQIKIEGVADFKSIADEAKKTQKLVADTFGKPTKFFDEASLKVIRAAFKSQLTEVKQHIVQIKSEYDSLTDKIKENEAAGKNVTKDLAKRLELQQRIASLGKTADSMRSQYATHIQGIPPELQQKGVSADEAPSGIGAVGRAAAGAAQKMPGIGGAVGGTAEIAGAGLGAAAMGLGGPLIAIIGAFKALEVVLGAVTERFEAYKGTTDQRLKLSAIGQTPAVSGKVRGQYESLGYDIEEAMSTQAAAASAMGGRGKTKDDSRLTNIMYSSRKYGMQPEQFTGAAEQLRQGGGTDVAQKNLGMIMSKMEAAFGKALDKSQATHFLNASVGLLGQINKEGIMDSSALLSVMTNLAAPGKGMGAEQAAQNLGGLNQAVTGSTGQSNAFFQMAYNQAGLGGGTMLGTQMAVREGFQEPDTERLSQLYGDTELGRGAIETIKATDAADEKKAKPGMEGKTRAQRAAGGILDQYKGIFGKEGGGGVAGMDFINKTFGGKTREDAAKVLALLTKIEEGGVKRLSKEDRKTFEDLGKDKTERWQEDVLTHLDNVARATKTAAAASKDVKIGTGEILAPSINALINSNTRLEAAITGQDTGGKGGKGGTPGKYSRENKTAVTGFGGTGIDLRDVKPVTDAAKRREKTGSGFGNFVKDLFGGNSAKDAAEAAKNETGAVDSVKKTEQKPAVDATDAASSTASGIADTKDAEKDARDLQLAESKLQTKLLQTIANNTKTPIGHTKREGSRGA